MWSGGSTGAEAAGGRVSSGADDPIPGNWVPQEASCGGALVAGGEAMATGAGASGRSATGCARPKGEMPDATPQVEEAPEPKGGKAAAGLAKGEGAAAWSANCEKPVAAAGAEALAALPKGEAMANRDGRTATGETRREKELGGRRARLRAKNSYG